MHPSFSAPVPGRQPKICGLCGVNPAEPWGSCQSCYEATKPMIESLAWQETGYHIGTRPEPIPAYPAIPQGVVVKHVEPGDGGCWFCCTKTDDMLFDTEFDTYLHESCLRHELEHRPDNPEAQIMKYLLD